MHMIKPIRRKAVSAIALGAMATSFLVAAPAGATVTTTTVYDVTLACPSSPVSVDSDALVTALMNAMTDPPAGAAAVVNFHVPAATACVVNLSSTFSAFSYISLTEPGMGDRDLTINGPTGTGQSLTIVGEHSAGAPVVGFASATGKTLTINNVTISGQVTQTATFPLVSVSGTSANLVLNGVTLTHQHLADTASKAAAIDDTAAAGDLTLTQVTVDDNVSGHRGAVYFTGHGAVAVTDSTFTHNYAHAASSTGGAVFHDGTGSALAVTGSTFTDNSADGDGGAIYATNVDAILTDSTFHGNESKNGSAGAVYVAAGTTGSTGTTFSTNRAKLDGGAILAIGAVTITDSTFTGNEATTRNSGAVVAAAGGTVSGSTFTSNTAATDGGAIDANTADLDITNSEFTDNEATTGNAGAVYTVNAGSTVTGSTFEGNTAPAGDGGALLTFGDVVRSTLVGNSAKQAGAAYVKGTVSTSTLWNNAATDAGAFALDGGGAGDVFGSILADDAATKDMTNSADLGANLVTKVPTGWTTLTTTKSKSVTIASLKLQALALNTTGPTNTGKTRTVALGTGSSAIDYYKFNGTAVAPVVAVTGDAALLPATDQRGVTRTLNGATDVGAYEHAAPAAVTCTTTTLGDIRFASNSVRLTATGKNSLKAFAKQIASAKCTQIRLNGHTSGVGQSAALELVRTRISKARIAAVKKYLKAQLATLKVTVTWTTHVYNANDPLVSNGGTGAAQNRRVQVIMRLAP